MFLILVVAFLILAVMVLIGMLKSMHRDLTSTHRKGMVAFEILYRAISEQNDLSQEAVDEIITQIAVSPSPQVRVALADRILECKKQERKTIGFGA